MYIYRYVQIDIYMEIRLGKMCMTNANYNIHKFNSKMRKEEIFVKFLSNIRRYIVYSIMQPNRFIIFSHVCLICPLMGRTNQNYHIVTAPGLHTCAHKNIHGASCYLCNQAVARICIHGCVSISR